MFDITLLAATRDYLLVYLSTMMSVLAKIRMAKTALYVTTSGNELLHSA